MSWPARSHARVFGGNTRARAKTKWNVCSGNDSSSPIGCDSHQRLNQPVLDDALRAQLEIADITEKVDRGGGFATPMTYHEVLGCTRKVHWTPQAREPWNGFRTAMDAGALTGFG